MSMLASCQRRLSTTLRQLLVRTPLRHYSELTLCGAPQSRLSSTLLRPNLSPLTRALQSSLAASRQPLDPLRLSDEDMIYHVIPPPGDQRPRTLVLCFDGTGHKYNGDDANVVKFFSSLKKDDRTEQAVYYQPGIGTYTSNTQNAKGLKAQADKALDQMFAWDLRSHVMGGYEFLMENYEEGDKISLFGFSRGAYTARALAGMIHKVGLLPAGNRQQIPFAYDMYTRTDKKSWEEDAPGFKRAFCIDVSIDFIGVWDSVNSVGLIPRTLPFTKSNKRIRVFRQALALDERRVRFKPAVYRDMDSRQSEDATQPDEESDRRSIPSLFSRISSRRDSPPNDLTDYESEYDVDMMRNSYEDEGTSSPLKTTDSLEVWFAGGHCDVGGGECKNTDKHSLSRIPLRWMIRECFKSQTGIRFYANSLRDIGLDPKSLYPTVIDRPGPIDPQPEHLTQEALGLSEEEYEVRDAQMKLHDPLGNWKSWYWWPLEAVPGLGEHALSWNMPNNGKERVASTRRGQLPWYVHRSVNIRMKADRKYKPRAYSKTAEMTFVD